MSKTSTELVRHALNGPTMGTRWSALFYSAAGFDAAPMHAALRGSCGRGGRADVHLEARQRPDAT